jgi:hypothetical protein
MTRTPGSPFRQERAAERDSFFMPVLAVSIAIALFAVVTQLLTATGAISLSPTQQLMVWLVAAGFIVLLWIVYMAAQAQARLAEALVATAAAGQKAEAAREAAQERAAKAVLAAARPRRENTEPSQEPRAAEAESQESWVPPAKLRRLDGSELSVNTADVFPDGCYLDSISEAQDTDTHSTVEGIGRLRGHVYQCLVVDLNRALMDRPHDAVVNVTADQVPSPPSGVRHPLVEFDDLTITPYVSDPGSICMRYSLRATGIRFAADDVATAARLIPAPAVPVDVQAETSLRGHGNGNEPEP